MTYTETDVASVVDAVKDIVPTLRENGREAEELRWLPEENIKLLEQAGVFRIASPERFGGLDFAVADQVRVLTEVARGCGSTGWVAMVWTSSTWLATLFSDQAQAEIFANPSVRISGGFTPNGTLTPAEGGYVLDGSWRFNSGCRGADWNIAASTVHHPDGTAEELVAVVPMSEFTIADDWHTSSAAATGSSTSTAKNVFVPAHRVISFADAVFGTTPDRTAVTGRGYGLFSFVLASAVATYVGIAKGALELFLGRVHGKAIAYTNYTDQAQHPLTQIQVATAANKITAAEAMQDRWLALLQERADSGAGMSDTEKAAMRGQAAYAIQLAKEAVDVLYNASGASVIARSAPLQRFHRDIQGLALHGLLLLNTNLEVHGRVLLGLEPDTPFL